MNHIITSHPTHITTNTNTKKCVGVRDGGRRKGKRNERKEERESLCKTRTESVRGKRGWEEREAVRASKKEQPKRGEKE